MKKMFIKFSSIKEIALRSAGKPREISFTFKEFFVCRFSLCFCCCSLLSFDVLMSLKCCLISFSFFARAVVSLEEPEEERNYNWRWVGILTVGILTQFCCILLNLKIMYSAPQTRAATARHWSKNNCSRPQLVTRSRLALLWLHHHKISLSLSVCINKIADLRQSFGTTDWILWFKIQYSVFIVFAEASNRWEDFSLRNVVGKTSPSIALSAQSQSISVKFMFNVCHLIDLCLWRSQSVRD